MEPGLRATADIAGNFTLQAPRAGSYRVHAERQGHFVYDGQIELGEEATQLSITLPHAREFFQTVDVAYSAPAIDPQQAGEQKQITGVEALEVPYPASQDVRNAMPLLSGVVQDTAGRPHFNGGAANQTHFTLDGFTLSDPFTGRLDARLNIESVRSIDYESTRYSAQKGRGSAGTVDLKTGMGDDRWRFGATNFIPSLSTQGDPHVDKWTPRVNVSGPIRKGRAWFYNGFDTFYDVDIIPGLPRGENRSRALTSSNLSRLQVNLTPANILSVSFLFNYIDENRNGLSFLDPVETTIHRRQNLYFASVKDQIFFHRGAFVELGFADSRTLARESPQGREIFEILPSGKRGNYFVDFTRHTDRRQWVANTYLPAFQSLGSHQLQFGVDGQRTTFDRAVDRHEYLVRRYDQSVARSVNFAGNRFQGRENLELSGYLQDRWTPVDGLLVEAGLRSDWDQVTHEALLSPRLSAAWLVPKSAPLWLREIKVSAGIGIFPDALNLSMITRQQDQRSISTFFSPDGAIRRGPVETAFLVNDRELHVPRYRTFSFSLERKLPFEFYGKAGYVRKAGQRGLSFFGDRGAGETAGEGEFYRLRNWRSDRYDALELTIRRSFGGTFEWWAGYTRSSARSSAVIDYSLENPFFAAQGPGPFAWDTPHRFLSWGWAPLPRGLLPRRLAFLARETSVAYLAEYRTGFPFSVVNEEAVLVGRPNDRRLPSYFNINLHFERRFRFMHYLWAWRAGLNNLTNNGNPNVVNNNIDSPTFLAYGRGQPRAVNVRLRFLGRR